MKAQHDDAGRSSFEVAERNDCSVRAWALARGITYAESHEAFRLAGRRTRGRTSQEVSARVMGTREIPARPLSYVSFLAEHPVGRYVVHLKGHAIAVVDGVQLDMEGKIIRMRSNVYHFWTVVKV